MLGGLVKSIFGGGDDDKGTPSQVVDTTPDEFAGLRPDIANILKGMFGSGVGGIPSYGGPTAAGVSGQEQSFLDRIGAFAGGGNPLSGGINQLLQQTLSGQFLQPGSNPFLQGQIASAQRPLIEAFKETTIPNLRSQFTAAGQMIQPQGSSPFDMAVARSQSGLMNALGDISTNMTGQNYQAERNRQTAAVDQGLRVGQGELQNLIAGLQACALPRVIQQKGIDTGLSQFNQQLSTLMQALALATGASTGSNVMLPGTAGQDTGSLLGGLGNLAVGGAALFSDRRAKENIKLVAKGAEGVNVYRFNYKGNPLTHVGVMAQEIEKVRPEAVIEFGGMKFILPERL